MSGKKWLFFILFFLLFQEAVFAKYDHPAKIPSGIKSDVWKAVEPYLLPEEHPIKGRLDAIFSASRVILNMKTLKNAGFIAPKPRKFTHLIVARHRDLDGYIFKLYLDAQRYYKKTPEWAYWIKRIQGANLIRDEIEAGNLQGIFKVPKKWIYLIPVQTSLPKEYLRKNFILVEENMHVYDSETNNRMWGSSMVTKELLAEYFQILENIGLADCAKPDNAPFSLDGRIAFVDTQTFNSWPVAYKKMHPYLASKMLKHWKSLTANARKK